MKEAGGEGNAANPGGGGCKVTVVPSVHMHCDGCKTAKDSHKGITGIEKALTVPKKDNVLGSSKAKVKKPVVDIRDWVERAKEKKPVVDIRGHRKVELKKDIVLDPKENPKKPKKKDAKGGKTKESGSEAVAAARI